MKKIKINYPFLLLISILFIGSCSKNLDINQDPSTFNLDDSPTEQLIVNGMITTAINLGANYNFACNMWSQYWASGPGISVNPIDVHTLLGSNAVVTRGWTQAYSRAMYDLFTVVKRTNSAHQKGVCQLMLAYNYQLLTDCFGDIPFSEALKALPSDGGIVSPKYDEAATVYDGIIALVDEAITNLNTSETIEGLTSSVDPMYGGDINKWLKFANTLKLKLYVRQFETNPSAITSARALIDAGTLFIGSNENAQIAFTTPPGANTNLNPLFASLESRTSTGNYFVLSNTTLDALNAKSDLRLNALYNLPSNPAVTVHTGIPQGSGGGGSIANLSTPGSYTYGRNVPVIFISSWESKFLQAEALARSGSSGDDETAFNDAVSESFEFLGLASDASDYLSLNPFDATNIESKVKSIAYEKWVSMNAVQSTESWIESRRYDTPTRIVFRGTGGIFNLPVGNTLALGTGYPVIFPYSGDEVSSNKNVPAQRVDISNPAYKTFWDN